MKISILNGIYTDDKADFRVSLPLNLMPVSTESGISSGYLRPFEGISEFTGDTSALGAADRGAINWYGEHYRVNGLNFYIIGDDGQADYIAGVGGSGQVRMDYSFDHLGIASSGVMWIYDRYTFTQVTDASLGYVKDFTFLLGNWIYTDGNRIQTSLVNDPFTLSGLYGSSEYDPDPIVALLRIRNELYVINRNTIEAFYQNGETDVFPLSRVDGSQINKGAIGTHAVIEFLGHIAFVGGDRNEPVGVWMGLNSQGDKISNREVDTILQSYTDNVLSKIVLEKRIDKDYRQLWLRLPDRILIYDANISMKSGRKIWFEIDAGINNIYWNNNKWIVGTDDGNIGYLDDSISTRLGENVEWKFETQLIYNKSKGGIVNDIELICLPGRNEIGNDPTIFSSYSTDGITWSNERLVSAGLIGNRNKRIKYFRDGFFRNYRIQRFRGNSDAFLSFVGIEANLEGLSI